MSLEYKRVSFPLTKGLETKVDEFNLQTPAISSMENCFQEKTGALRKRLGGAPVPILDSNGASVGSPIALGRHGDDAVLFANANANGGPLAYSYSRAAARWINRSSPAPCLKLGYDRAGMAESNIVVQTDSATCANGFTVYTWVQAISGTLGIRCVVQDADGVTVYDGTLKTNAVSPHCTVTGNVVVIIYLDVTTGDLYGRRFDCTTLATVASSAAAAAVAVVTDNNTAGVFDTDMNATYGVFLVYRTTAANEVKIGFVNTTTLAFGSSQADVTTGDATKISCAVSESGASPQPRHGYCYIVGTSPNDCYAAHRSWSGAAWTNTATSAVIDTALVGTYAGLTCAFEAPSSNTILNIMAWGDSSTTVSTGVNGRIFRHTYSTSGTAVARVSGLRKSYGASRPFTDANGRQAMWIYGLLGGPGGTQKLYLVDTSNFSFLARALPGTAFVYTPAFLTMPRVTTTPSGEYRVAMPVKNTIDDLLGTDGSSVRVGCIGLRVDYAGDYKTVNYGDSMILAGGIALSWDGHGFVEVGFMTETSHTEIDIASTVGAGALTGTGTNVYGYLVIPEWTDDTGRRFLGATTGVCSETMTNLDNTNTLSIPTIQHTFKKGGYGRSNLVFGIYRTISDGGVGAAFYRVGEVANSESADEVTFVDLLADSAITDNEQCYLSGEPTPAQNIAPQGGSIMCTWRRRVCIAGVEDDCEIWTSKLDVAGLATAFSDEALLIQIPRDGGPITALIEMGDALVVFKTGRIYVVRGDGPDNNGRAGEFSPAELSSADVGALSQRAVALTSEGIFFASTRGPYLLDTSFRVSYVGASIEGLWRTLGDPVEVTGCTALPRYQQVRFVLAKAGYQCTVVYDYFHRQWYRFFENYIGESGQAILFTIDSSSEEEYMWIGEDQDSITIEDRGLSTIGTVIITEYQISGPYEMRFTLGWLTGVNGDIAVRRIGLLGTVGDDLSLSIFYYANTDAAPAGTIEEVDVVPGDMRQWWRVKVPPCEQFKFLVSDGAPLGESFYIYGVRYEVADRGGTRKLS